MGLMGKPVFCDRLSLRLQHEYNDTSPKNDGND